MPVFRLTDDNILFPPPHLAEDGLLAVGGDLSPERLIAAYRSGVFPWYSADAPILWWSPDPRMIMFPQKIHIARRLRRTLRRGEFHVTADTAFPEIIAQCAHTPRQDQGGTWILPEMIRAYTLLHTRGYAHSVECWRDGKLVGGLYGVSIGAAFFAESMYSTVSNASKVALVALAMQCQQREDIFIDCQMPTAHLTRMGARPVPRPTFIDFVKEAVQHRTTPGPWKLASDLFQDI